MTREEMIEAMCVAYATPDVWWLIDDDAKEMRRRRMARALDAIEAEYPEWDIP